MEAEVVVEVAAAVAAEVAEAAVAEAEAVGAAVVAVAEVERRGRRRRRRSATRRHRTHLIIGPALESRLRLRGKPLLLRAAADEHDRPPGLGSLARMTNGRRRRSLSARGRLGQLYGGFRRLLWDGLDDPSVRRLERRTPEVPRA